MRRGATLLAAAVAACTLAACGDREQKLTSGVKQDSQAFQGTGLPYALPGWKQGDKGSWEQHLKTRTQQTQNEYTKVN